MNDLNAHPLRRAAVGVLAGTLACTGAALTAGLTPASAVEGFAFERLFGDDRYETAAAIAADTFPDGADTAIIARDNDFADALTGNYLAGVLDAPVLLTRTGDLPDATAQALDDLGVQRVVIVGGDTAVSPAVEAELDRDYDVRRLEGRDRYLTAQAVAADAAGDGADIGSVDGLRTAVLGNGQAFPDVLAAGPLSYAESLPLTITRPGDLPAPTRQTLEDLEIEQVIIVGGDTAVSPAVRAEVARITGNPVLELEGGNRFLTANAIADFAYDELGFDATHVNLARSEQFADALAGGPHGGAEQAPILLTTAGALSEPTRDYLEQRSDTLRDGHIFGGTAAVSTATASAAERAARGAGTTGLSVTPDSTATATAVINPDTTTADDRTYSVSGLTSGQEYRITLVKAENTSTNSSGETVFVEDGTTGLAATGSPTADIKTVNGRPAENNAGDGMALSTNPAATSPSAVFAAGSAGTASFVVDGDAAESVRPVVYRNGGAGNSAADGGNSPRLDLEDDGTAADEADTGGVIVYSAPPATNAAVTVRPELIAASIVSTTTTATASMPVGSVVRFTFDEEITGTRPVNEPAFHVYDLEGAPFTAVDGESTIESAGNSVLVRFAAVDTAGEAARLRVATVDEAAVNDNEGADNPIGDAPLGSATATTRPLSPGVTLAPDLVSVGNFRASAATPTATIVEFTFDEPAFTVEPGGFGLVTTDGMAVVCEATDTLAGGNPGPNQGADTTIDAVCEEPTSGSTTRDLTAAGTARGIVDAGTVSDDDPDTTGATVEGDGASNALQATQSPDVASTDPDLTGAQLQLAPDSSETGEDTVVYTFDEAVVINNAAGSPLPAPLGTADPDGATGQLDFVAYLEDGTEVTASSVQRSSSNASQVIATFDADDLDTAVGASVRAAAVTGQTGTSGRSNEADEVGLANSSTTTVGQTAGRTAAPDLIGVEVTTADGETVVTYTFDEELDGTTSSNPFTPGQTNVAPERFFLTQADGTRLTCTEGSVGTTPVTDSEFTCTAFSIGSQDATDVQIRNAVAGSADDNAVLSGDDDATGNPEGAERVMGTTGTARQ